MFGKLSEDEVETYREVGRLTSEIRREALEMVKPGENLLEVAEKVEEMIRERGAKPAFPCNISLNEKAAHYSPPDDDETIFEEGDLVKVDIGAHIDGYIADTASTVYVEEGEKGSEKEVVEEAEESKEDEIGKDMVRAVNHVIERAIEVVEPGVNVGEIGRVIEDTAKKQGYNPISNLTGHNLLPYSLHGGISIPNVEKDKEEDLEPGDVIALEPFITNGEGEVEESPEVYIFSCMKEGGGVSGRMAQQTLRKIKSNYGNLPFAERWLMEDLSRIRLQVTLRDLIGSKALRPYYVLKEVEDGLVAQAEHTMIVTEEGCEVTTG